MISGELNLAVRSWSAWAPGLVELTAWDAWAENPREIVGGELPSLKSVSPMLRRRLSKSGRVAFEVALNCIARDELENVELVFASRHGESETTERLLTSISRRESLSPNDFSLSVHNSVVGLISIFANNTQPSHALSARTSSFAAGLLESALRVNEDSSRNVLYVYCDEQIPKSFVTEVTDQFPLHGLAFLLSKPSESRDPETILRLRYDAPRALNCSGDHIAGRGQDAALSRFERLPQQLEFLRAALSKDSIGSFRIDFGKGELVVTLAGTEFRNKWRISETDT